MANPNCVWCGAELSAYSEVRFKDDLTIAAKCPSDGEYVMLPDLVKYLPEVAPETRQRVHEYFLRLRVASDDVRELSRFFIENGF